MKIPTEGAIIRLERMSQHNPPLITMDVPMFGAMRQPLFRGDGQLEEATVAVMASVTLAMGMMVKAFVVFPNVVSLEALCVAVNRINRRLRSVMAWLPSCQSIKKIGEPLLSRLERDRFMTEATFHFGILSVIRATDARRDANRPFQRIAGSVSSMHARIGIEHDSNGRLNRVLKLANDQLAMPSCLRPVNSTK